MQQYFKIFILSRFILIVYNKIEEYFKLNLAILKKCTQVLVDIFLSIFADRGLHDN